MNYKYDEPSDITKELFSRVVAGGVIVLICQAVVNAVHNIDDYNWLLEQYGVLLEDPDPQIRGVVVTCLGHLARINEEANKSELLGILEPLLKCPDIAGRVEDAIGDVQMFL